MRATPPELLELLSLEGELELWRLEKALGFVRATAYSFFALSADSLRLGKALSTEISQLVHSDAVSRKFEDLDAIREWWDAGTGWMILDIIGCGGEELEKVSRSLQGNRDWFSLTRRKLVLLVEADVFPRFKRTTPDFFALVQFVGHFRDFKHHYERLELPLDEVRQRWQLGIENLERDFQASLASKMDAYRMWKVRTRFIEAAREAEKWRVVSYESQELVSIERNRGEGRISGELLKFLTEANLRLGNLKLAGEFLEQFVESRIGGDETIDDILFSYSMEFELCHVMGDWSGARRIAEDLESNGMDFWYNPAIAVASYLRAKSHTDLGEFDHALSYSEKSIQLASSCGRKDVVVDNRLLRAVIFGYRGDLENEIMELENCHDLLQENYGIGRHARFLLCFGNVLLEWGRVSEAIKAVDFASQLLDSSDVVLDKMDCAFAKAAIFRLIDETAEANTLYDKLKAKAKSVGHKAGMARAISGKALVFLQRGNAAKALLLFKEEEQLIRGLGSKLNLARCLGHQALCLKRMGDITEALAMHKEEEALIREMGYQRGLAVCLGNQAVIYKHLDHYGEALALHKEEENLERNLGNRFGLASSLGNQALIMLDMGRTEEAMTLLREQQRLLTNLGAKSGLARCLYYQSIIHQKAENQDESLLLAQEAVTLAQVSDPVLHQQLSLHLEDLTSKKNAAEPGKS